MPRPRRQSAEELHGGLAGLRMPPSRDELGERREHEAALPHARMGKDRVGAPSAQPSVGAGRAPHASNVEQVDVDLARPVSKAGRAPDGLLDALRDGEQPLRRSGPPDRGDGVPEGGLVRVADGVGAIERRNREHGRETRDLGEGSIDVGASVAEV